MAPERSNPARILLVDDDALGCKLLSELLVPEGYAVDTVHDGETGLARVAAAPPDAVVLDLDMPGMGGLAVLERLKQIDARLPVVILTGKANIPSAVRATELGAFAYLLKGLDLDEVTVVLRRALEYRALQSENEALRARLGGPDADLAAKMGSSRAVQRLIEQVRQVADTPLTVLVVGETGSGKEVVAQAIHRTSERRGEPLVALDCGAIPETLLESELFGHEKGAFTGADRGREGRLLVARGGTVFLDEVENLPLSMQAKLLRVLEERRLHPVGAREPVALDARFVAASNQDLQRAAGDKRFRQDLYFRLAEFTIRVPALRERAEDIPYLARRFVEAASIELRRPVRDVTAGALDLLREHAWPGNVRELRNVMRKAVLGCEELVLRESHVREALCAPARNDAAAAIDAVPAPVPSRSLKEIANDALERAERDAIFAALRAARGNKSEAARALRTDYKTLHVKIKRYGIGTEAPPSP